MIYKNIDGINTRISGNEKLAKEKEVFDELEADALVGFFVLRYVPTKLVKLPRHDIHASYVAVLRTYVT